MPENRTGKKISGTVYVVFTINSDGSIEDNSVKTLTKEDFWKRNLDIPEEILKNENCEHEAIRFVKGLPSYTPATRDGNDVLSTRIIPIKFKIKRGKKYNQG